MFETKSETIDQFMTCKAHRNIKPGNDWKLIFNDDPDKQFDILQTT